MIKRSDTELIDSVLRGNLSDYNVLIDRYKDKAFGLLRRMLKNEMDAEEALQDSFVKAYAGLKSFRKESEFSTWLYRIVYNTALNRVKSKRYRTDRKSDSIDQFYDLKSESRTGLEKKETSGIVAELVNSLPEKYSAVIDLFYMQGLSIEEISEITGESVSNVKVKLFRARKQLKEKIEKQGLKEELL